MQWFNKLSPAKQAVVMLALPQIALIWLAVSDVREAHRQVVSNEQQILFSNVAAAAGQVIHETQVERGLTSGTLGPDGDQFARRLLDQRKQRDLALASLKADIEKLDQSKLPQDVVALINKSLSFTEAIRAMRDRVDRGAVTQVQAVTFYKAVINTYLELAENMPRLSESRAVSSLGEAYTALLRLKDAAGLERNVVSDILAADAMTVPRRVRLSELVREQEIYYRRVSTWSDTETRKVKDRSFASPAYTTATDIRNKILENPSGAGFTTDAVEWFDAQSRKINTLKELENEFIARIRVVADESAGKAATTRLLALLIAFVGTLLFTAIVVWNVVRFKKLHAALGAEPDRLNNAISRLAAGDFDVDLYTPEEATGVMSGLQVMKGQLKDQIEKDRQALIRSQRISEALDNVGDPVVVSDDESNIVFVNKAARTAIQKIAADPSSGYIIGSGGDLIGSSLHTLPGQTPDSVQRLEALTGSEVSRVNVGEWRLRITASPVINSAGNRVGTVLVWIDRTAQFRVESEVENVVGAAKAGDLSRRICTDELEGFFATLSTGVNSLLDVAEKVIGDTVRVLGAMAKGNLTEKIRDNYQGSFRTLKDDANKTIENLTGVLGQIQDSASSVKGGASEIAQANAELRTRTEEQASGLERTADNMRQLTDMVKASTENARRAEDLAQSARSEAQRGGGVVSDTIAAMQEINTSSRRVVDIISVIDEIAFQTNLLALNAAVEAARAGEQGRGFAVVAKEVRNLAGRSASAAREIKDLIQDSSAKVEEGTRLVELSGQSLNEIVAGVQVLSDTIGEIALSSQKQYEGIDQVNETISEIDAFTQQNASMVEQASAASESLGNQATQMDELVAFFQLAGRIVDVDDSDDSKYPQQMAG